MISRRGILKGMGGIAIAPTFFQSMAAEAATSSNTILVCIMLSGGNDGLNTVIPLSQYGTYNALRTPAPPPPGQALAYTEASLAATMFDTNPATPAGSASQFAFAPSMTAMRNLYATGRLAVVTGVGLPEAELNPLSHLNGELDWQTGQINLGPVPPTGWLGLTLDGVAAGSFGPTASMAGSTPLLLGASGSGFVVNPPIDNFSIWAPSTDNYFGLVEAYGQISVLPASSTTSAFVQAQALAATGDISTVQNIARAYPATDYPVPSYLDTQLRDIARLILAGAGIRGFYAVQGNYDTHSGQAAVQPGNLATLGAAMAQFYAYLQQHGASQNVVVMTMSDFGRRPAANLDFGTDHGGASVSFVLGDTVQGGVFGKYPSLTRFDANGNLRPGVDFRNVLSDLIGTMGGNATTILGQTWPKLGFV